MALITVIGLIILALGWRAPNRFFRWSVLVWALLLFSSSVAIVVSDPGTVFRAETLRLEAPFAWSLLPLDSIYFVITLIWFLRGRNQRQQRSQQRAPSSWARINTTFLMIAVMFIPLEYLLFNAGELHGPADQVAVTLTFVQYGFINLALVPWGARKGGAYDRSRN